MAKVSQRQQARDMRRQGRSIKDIARTLAVSKSSASVWCEDIVLTPKQLNVLHVKMVEASKVGRVAGTNKNKENRLLAMAEEKKRAEHQINHTSDRDILFLGLGLYWGEGSKNSERKFVFTNSDPASIKLMMKWVLLQGFKKEDFIFRVHINEIHKKREKVVTEYWKKYLNLSNQQMRKTVYIKTANKKVYENYPKYYGIGRLTLKNSTRFKYRIMAMLDRVK